MAKPYGTIAKYRNTLAIKKHNALIQPWASAMALDVASVFWATWKGVEERLPKGDEVIEAERPRDSRDLKNKYSAIIRVEVKRHSAEMQRVVENYIYRVWLAGAVEQCRDLGCAGWFLSSLSKSSTSSESTSAPDGTSFQEAPRVRNVKADKSGWVSLPNLRAQTYAKKHAAEAVTNINDTTRKEMARIVSDGVKSGSSYNDIAKNIKSKFEEFAVPMPQKHIANRAVLVAVTELANAYCEGNAQVGSYLQDNGVKMMKAWQTLEDNRVSDGCQENERAGWIPINEKFPSGHMHPPRFPGCRCDFLQDILEEDMLGKPISASYGKQYRNDAPNKTSEDIRVKSSNARVYSPGKNLINSEDDAIKLFEFVKSDENFADAQDLMQKWLEEYRGSGSSSKLRFITSDAKDKRLDGEWPSAIEYVVNSQGYAGLPKKISSGELDTDKALYRGIKAESKETLKKYHNDLVNGDWYYSAAGGALHGKGMYAGTVSGIAKRYTRSGDFSLVEQMQFTRGAKIADVSGKDEYDENENAYYLRQNHPSEAEYLRKAYNKVFSVDLSENEFDDMLQAKVCCVDLSDMLAAIGYDGMRLDTKDIMLVLNRTALEVVDDDV